jgi:hypothetical protein
VTFGQAAVQAIFDALLSHAMELGVFERVNGHEPKSAPGSGLTASMWAEAIRPVQASGLAATSGVLDMRVRVMSNMLQEPQDGIDPAILTAVSTLLNDYSSDFALGGNARNVDLLGEFGEALSAKAGYLEMDKRMYRVMDITIPIVVNDMWAQAP